MATRTTRIGINGFGRIGRMVLRSLRDDAGSNLEVGLINDLTDPATLALLTRYDSVHGRFSGNVTAAEKAIVVDGKSITVTAEKDPSKIPWRDAGVDIVLECTGRFTDGDKAHAHIEAGAKKVIISAPAKGKDVPTFCIGINADKYDAAKHHIVSNASCTTNCLAPVVKVLNDSFGIVNGVMTTIHSYTNDQVILDQPHKDLRRARAAGLSMIPTTTGAAKALSEVIPEMKGKLDGFAVRVPTPNVSLVDFTAVVEKPATVAAVNEAYKRAAAQGPLAGVMAITDEQLVSIDFNGDRHSSTIDARSTMVVGQMVKVCSWYDNESGYAQRLYELARLVADKGVELAAAHTSPFDLSKIRSVADLPVEGKRVFVRVDFNVPLTPAGGVADDSRITAALPTINHLVGRNARVILASHLGRPDGKPNPKYSLEPAAARLAALIGRDVILADEAVGDGAHKVVADLRDGQVAMLENLRFNPGEEGNDDAFSRALASHAEVYVNDAFGTAHRAHASTAGMVKYLPVKGAGFLMLRELQFLGRLLGSVDKPYLAVVGGAKVSDKIAVLENLAGKVDAFLIGGAMANTFLKARGTAVGSSRVEEDKLGLARSFLRTAEERKSEVLLPVDVVCARSLDASSGEIHKTDVIPDGLMALDIGPETARGFADRIARARTVFWNGPMGVFEKAPFAQGTLAVARAIAACPGLTVVGGGDSVAALNQSGLGDKVTHVSTGGGASLELIEGKALPGVIALQQ